MNAISVKPNAVAINASSLSFQTYSSGVLTSAKCGTEINHAVTAVGYNASASTPYYIVRNSWGESWGNGGYVLIGASGDLGVCGINQFVAYPNTKTWT
jgi:C1A family cysteine protease